MPTFHGNDPLDVEVGRVVQRLRTMTQPSAEQRAVLTTFMSRVLPATSARLFQEHLASASGPELASIVAAVVFDADAGHARDLEAPGAHVLPRGASSGCRSAQLTDLLSEMRRLRRSL